MATTQQLLDLKYGRQLLEDRARLSELFSESILGSAYNQNIYSLEGIMNILQITVGWTSADLKGFNLLTKLKELYASGNTETELDLSSLTALEYLYVDNSANLTSIGNLLHLKNLKVIDISFTSIAYIGETIYNTNLIKIIARYSNLYLINMDYTSLIEIDFYNAKLNNNEVNNQLSKARTGRAAYGKLTTLNLGGANMAIPTGGAANADYVWLINNGVSVTIRTA